MCSILNSSGGDIDITDIAIRRGVPDKNASEIVFIKIGPSVSRFLDIDTRSKRFQTFEIRPLAVPRLKRCLLRSTVAASVEQECGVRKSRGPLDSREAGNI